MDIRIMQLLEGAREATGIAVFIDVFRAFTTACFIADNGANRILPVADIQAAYKLREKIPEAVLIGERNGIKPDNFNFGNSPSEIEYTDFHNKTVIHTTSAGTQGFQHAEQADELMTGSFVNASAIVSYILDNNPAAVSLVCMGYRTLSPAEEDTLCAEYIRDLLLGYEPDVTNIIEQMKTSTHAQKFFDIEKQWAPEKDFELCSTVNKFDFVLRLCNKSTQPSSLEKIHI